MFYIILNPVAGSGRSNKVLPELTARFDARGMEYEVLTTTAPLDAREMARKVCQTAAFDDGSTGIIGIGGDGTLQEIAAGMADAYKGLAVFPAKFGFISCGSGNDFSLCLPGGKDKLKAFRLPAQLN